MQEGGGGSSHWRFYSQIPKGWGSKVPGLRWKNGTPGLRRLAPGLRLVRIISFVRAPCFRQCQFQGSSSPKTPKLGNWSWYWSCSDAGQLNFACEDVYFESLAGTQKAVKSGQIFPFAIGWSSVYWLSYDSQMVPGFSVFFFMHD